VFGEGVLFRPVQSDGLELRAEFAEVDGLLLYGGFVHGGTVRWC
jgi:hypothetical protein